MADTEGFEDFYIATVGRLLGQLFPVIGDLHEAEEVVQEAFARASTRWSRIRDYDVPEAWVRRVAMNLAADRYRRGRRQAAALQRAGPLPSVPPVSVEALALVHVLGTLPVHQRQAIVPATATPPARRPRSAAAGSAGDASPESPPPSLPSPWPSPAAPRASWSAGRTCRRPHPSPACPPCPIWISTTRPTARASTERNRPWTRGSTVAPAAAPHMGR